MLILSFSFLFSGFALTPPFDLHIEVIHPSIISEAFPAGFPGHSLATSPDSSHAEVTGEVSPFDSGCQLTSEAGIALLVDGRCSVEQQLEALSGNNLPTILVSDSFQISLHSFASIQVVEIPHEVAEFLSEWSSREKVTVKTIAPTRSLRGSTGGGGYSISYRASGGSGSKCSSSACTIAVSTIAGVIGSIMYTSN